MKRSNNQHGFAALELILIAVVVVFIGFISVKVFKKPTATKTTVVSSQVTMPTKIQSKADVSQSIKALDAAPIDSKLDPNQLNGSINSLL
jgi:cell division protein FtsN